MLADFYITMLSNDMKIAVQKNHLGGYFRGHFRGSNFGQKFGPS